MSRALDSDVRASLSQEQSLAAYEAISRVLVGDAKKYGDQLLEIEFLGKSHPLPPGAFYLEDGNALALSKQGLVQAFFAARGLFQDHNENEPWSPDALFAITSVILLMDPEHLTAANARKRLVSTNSASNSPEEALDLVRRDKFFIDSLLTSRLHRHTKSPTLWSHRRWLVERAIQYGEQPDVEDDIREIVLVSGERHPKNYYAWCHARWLTGIVPGDKKDRVLVELVGATKSWCLRHDGDISGWTFLSFLLMQADDQELWSSSFEWALGQAVSFVLVNESRWVFLRTLAASGAVGETELEQFHSRTVALLETIQKQEDREVLTRAISWSKTYRKPA